jgi:MFS family permease
MAQRFVPASQPPGGQHFDYSGAVTLFVSLLSLLMGLTLSQGQGFTNPLSLTLFGVWLLSLIIFIQIELRVPSPMIDLRLFHNRQFSINLGTGLVTFVAIAGIFILMPFYLENILGYPIQWVGMLQAIVPVMLGIMAPISGMLSDRFGSRVITVTGLAVLLVGYVATATLDTGTTALGYVLRLLPIGMGMGIFQSPNNSAIMGAVPRAQLGVVSGLLSVNRTLGQTTGIAVVGAIWAGRVVARSPDELPGGSTTAPTEIQVAAMQDTFYLVVGLVALALATAVWGWWQERRQQVITLNSRPPATVIVE